MLPSHCVKLIRGLPQPPGVCVSVDAAGLRPLTVFASGVQVWRGSTQQLLASQRRRRPQTDTAAVQEAAAPVQAMNFSGVWDKVGYIVAGNQGGLTTESWPCSGC